MDYDSAGPAEIAADIASLIGRDVSGASPVFSPDA
jgi:hypothetical protein